MTFPSFNVGEVLTASDMNAVGLWLISTRTIPNGNNNFFVDNVFSANFNNYKIVISNVGSTAGGHSIKFQLNNSTGNTYNIGGVYGTFGSASVLGYGPPVTDSWTDILPLDLTETAGTIELYSPFLNRRTLMSSFGVRSGAVSPAWYWFHGQDTSTNSSTGFRIFPIAGGSQFTGGTVRVYGYRN